MAHSGIQQFDVPEIHVANAITIFDSDVSSFKSGHENTFLVPTELLLLTILNILRR